MTNLEFKNKRKLLGLSQLAIAKYFGLLSNNSISEIELGKRPVPLNAHWIFKNLMRELKKTDY